MARLTSLPSLRSWRTSTSSGAAINIFDTRFINTQVPSPTLIGSTPIARAFACTGEISSTSSRSRRRGHYIAAATAFRHRRARTATRRSRHAPAATTHMHRHTPAATRTGGVAFVWHRNRPRTLLSVILSKRAAHNRRFGLHHEGNATLPPTGLAGSLRPRRPKRPEMLWLSRIRLYWHFRETFHPSRWMYRSHRQAQLIASGNS